MARIAGNDSFLHNDTKMAAVAPSTIIPHALLVDPDDELHFVLSKISSSTDGRCTMTLRHPGTTDEYLAFKVGFVVVVAFAGGRFVPVLRSLAPVARFCTVHDDEDFQRRSSSLSRFFSHRSKQHNHADI